uniref:Neurotransmitter-gated ion-channel ligand-binding domain-containing protein n=1 Tax=Meloidogyne incognita TaxID=6306 RepID=A0A914NEH9_MELIC
MKEEGKIENDFGRKLSEIEEKEVKKEEKIKVMEGKETKKSIEEEKVEKKFVKKGKMKDEKYKEKIKNIPELPLLKSILPWIPHTLRKHKQVHKAKKAKMRFTLDKTVYIKKKTKEIKPTTTSTTSTTTTTTTTTTTMEIINEEELALNLQTDSLYRNESILRDLLKNEVIGGEKEDLGSEAFRDLGGSFITPLLKEKKYDNKSIPLVFADEPLKVFVALEVIHLGNFDNFQMEYELDVFLHMQWYDVRLANNFSKPVRIMEKKIIDRIWKPDALFLNSKFSYFHVVTFPNFLMRIYPNGHVTYTVRVTLLPDCQMNFCNFPHDKQRCDLLISSIAHPKSVLEFRWASKQPIIFAKRVLLSDLRIQSIGTEQQCQIDEKLIPSSCLLLLFRLKREGARYIAEKYLPSVLAMVFSWVAPYVPYNYEEVRIITPITVLTSYLTSLDIWFVVIKAFTVLSLVESLAVMAYIKRGRAI